MLLALVAPFRTGLRAPTCSRRATPAIVDCGRRLDAKIAGSVLRSEGVAKSHATGTNANGVQGTNPTRHKAISQMIPAQRKAGGSEEPAGRRPASRRAYRYRGPPFEPPPSQASRGYLGRGASAGGGPGRGRRQGGRGKPVASPDQRASWSPQDPKSQPSVHGSHARETCLWTP